MKTVIRKNDVNYPQDRIPSSFDSENVAYGDTNVKEKLDEISSNLAGKFSSNVAYKQDTLYLDYSIYDTLPKITKYIIETYLPALTTPCIFDLIITTNSMYRVSGYCDAIKSVGDALFTRYDGLVSTVGYISGVATEYTIHS